MLAAVARGEAGPAPPSAHSLTESIPSPPLPRERPPDAVPARRERRQGAETGLASSLRPRQTVGGPSGLPLYEPPYEPPYEPLE